MSKLFDERQDEMLQRIIGLGERSLKKSYYPELQKQIHELEKLNQELAQQIEKRQKAEEQKARLEMQLQQAQKMEAIGNLAGGIAHDFNNILSAIIGYAELAKIHMERCVHLTGCQAKGDIDGVLRSADRARQLVEQILSFSRQRVGNMAPVDLGELLVETIRMLRPLIPTTIAIETATLALQPLVYGDVTQLHQVLMNLGTNAYHAMRQSGGRLQFEVAEKDLVPGEPLVSELNLAPGPYLVLRVTDTGCGMDRKTLARIFDPYFSTKIDDGGTGLGLSVVHGIVTSHHGHISVYSEPGQGTTFRIYLPKLKKTPGEPAKESKPEPTASGVFADRLLVVDDERALREVMARILENLGYTVTIAPSATDALRIFTDSPDTFDMLISDMNMPEMNGAELITKVRKIRPDLPVILCTGFSETMNKETTKSLGRALHLMKPVTQQELNQAIRSLLDHGNSQ